MDCRPILEAGPREINALVNKKWPSDIPQIQEELSVLQGIIKDRRKP